MLGCWSQWAVAAAPMDEGPGCPQEGRFHPCPVSIGGQTEPAAPPLWAVRTGPSWPQDQAPSLQGCSQGGSPGGLHSASSGHARVQPRACSGLVSPSQEVQQGLSRTLELPGGPNPSPRCQDPGHGPPTRAGKQQQGTRTGKGGLMSIYIRWGGLRPGAENPGVQAPGATLLQEGQGRGRLQSVRSRGPEPSGSQLPTGITPAPSPPPGGSVEPRGCAAAPGDTAPSASGCAGGEDEHEGERPRGPASSQGLPHPPFATMGAGAEGDTGGGGGAQGCTCPRAASCLDGSCPALGRTATPTSLSRGKIPSCPRAVLS